MKYILDSNIIDAYIKDDINVKLKVMEIGLNKDHDLYINAISYYEIKRWLLYKDAKKQMKIFNGLCDIYNDILLLDDLSFFDKAAEIWADLEKKGNHIKNMDILIASLADPKESIIVTNDGHFRHINNLNIEDWIE